MPASRRAVGLLIVLMFLIPAPVKVLGGDGGTPLADETTRFTDVTVLAGFPHDLARSRVAWGDYDNDGWEDLLLDGRMLWRNDGDGTFSDVTAQAGLGGLASHGGVFADYDNDGDLDFYANVRSASARDALWRNDGDGTFSDVTYWSGEISDYLPTEGVAWGDYDDDGYLDLYVANYETASVDPDAELGIGTPDVLYRNRGDGTFENVSRDAGVELDGEPLCGRGVVWADYDDDGDVDIYVSNYRLDPNLLWRNEGDGTFTNVARQALAEGYSTNDPPGGNRYGHSIGSDFGDVDNDGDMDLYVSNLAHPRFIMFSDKSMFLKNQGNGAFVDRFYGSGIEYCETSSDPSWADYDNDGDLDLYFTAVYEGRLSRMFRNVGRDRFEDATTESATAVDNGWGTGWCDYDHDGDLDLAVGSGSGFRLLENGGNDNHWLQVELRGLEVNRMAVGARVRVELGDVSMVRDVRAGRGTTSQDMLACHFGLGDHAGTVDVDVRWPGDRAWTSIGTFETDQRVSISQGMSAADASVSLGIEPEEARVGERVTFTADVRNEADEPIDFAEVTFTVQGVGQVGPDYSVGPLDPGQVEEVETLWQPTTEGVFQVVATIVNIDPGDGNPDNDQDWGTLTVRGANEAPVASLVASPTRGPPGSDFTFDASGSTDDTGVAQYFFEFDDGTNTGWVSTSVVSHGYTMEGEYLVSVYVMDRDGLQSTNFATALVTVSSMGFRPTAEIITILPNPARGGEVVTLHGRGTAVGDATIAGHSWNSSRDGHLGDLALLTTTSLSLGEHTIIYKVRDDRGLWSDPVTETLTVLPREGDWSVVVETPGEGAKAEGDILVVSGVASYTGGQVVSVEVRLDNGPWEVASGTASWVHELDLTGLEEGYHTIRVRASSFDSTSGMVFINFTIGDVPVEDAYGYLEWLMSPQGMMVTAGAIILIVTLAVAAWGRSTRPRG